MEKNKSDFSWKTLLSVGGAFAPDKSTKQRIINVLYPFVGCIGVVLFAIVIANDFVRWRRSKKALPQA